MIGKNPAEEILKGTATKESQKVDYERLKMDLESIQEVSSMKGTLILVGEPKEYHSTQRTQTKCQFWMKKGLCDCSRWKRRNWFWKSKAKPKAQNAGLIQLLSVQMESSLLWVFSVRASKEMLPTGFQINNPPDIDWGKMIRLPQFTEPKTSAKPSHGTKKKLTSTFGHSSGYTQLLASFENPGPLSCLKPSLPSPNWRSDQKWERENARSVTSTFALRRMWWFALQTNSTITKCSKSKWSMGLRELSGLIKAIGTQSGC